MTDEETRQLVELQTILRIHVDEVRRSSDEAREWRRTIEDRQNVITRKIEKIETVVAGNPDSEEPGIDSRMREVESVIKSAKHSWQIMAALVGLFATFTAGIVWVAHQFGFQITRV